MDNEPEYDVLNFNDLSSMDFILEFVFACSAFTILLDLKPLPDSLKYAILEVETLPVINAPDLEQGE